MSTISRQLDLFASTTEQKETWIGRPGEIAEILSELLNRDLSFRGQNTLYFPHGIHGFPAKFPPQLPRLFISALTAPGEIVLDPMVGSGTTVVEAIYNGRVGIGVDIDPIALILTRTKTAVVKLGELRRAGEKVIAGAVRRLETNEQGLEAELSTRFDLRSREFIDYWFHRQTQCELLALVQEIESIEPGPVRGLLEVAFSASIIAKSGGVSRARDLAHTRPHRDLAKPRRSAIQEFARKVGIIIRGLASVPRPTGQALSVRGDARGLPLKTQSVDLVVTSPPYASNAIDYMRAHKFSLVWFGHPVDELSTLRSKYIGHETAREHGSLPLPGNVVGVVDALRKLDARKARALANYFLEMKSVLTEVRRVLKPGKAAVVVVGSSTMRGLDTKVGESLAEIGRASGLELVGIGLRALDRDKRMMPARWGTRKSSIEARMHEEHVIGFVNPA